MIKICVRSAHLVRMNLNPIKSLREIESEVKNSSNGDISLLFLDTGGLIDIAHSARAACFGRDKETNPIYNCPMNFMYHLANTQPVLMTAKTFLEVLGHCDVRLNAHEVEISHKMLRFADKCYDRFIDLHSDVTSFVAYPELLRYAVYWTSKGAFSPEHKKAQEGFSEVDRQILFRATYLASCRIGNRKISPVGVITSDKHIFEGLAHLEKLGYPPVYAINTRREKVRWN